MLYSAMRLTTLLLLLVIPTLCFAAPQQHNAVLRFDVQPTPTTYVGSTPCYVSSIGVSCGGVNTWTLTLEDGTKYTLFDSNLIITELGSNPRISFLKMRDPAYQINLKYYDAEPKILKDGPDRITIRRIAFSPKRFANKYELN